MTPEVREKIAAKRRGKASPALIAALKENNKKQRLGADHPNWKGGGRQTAIKLFPLDGVDCERECGRPATDRHHKDRDTQNNERYNIEFLCKNCHGAEHAPRSNAGRLVNQ